jgi:type I restriction enzyme S subunit
MKLNDICDLITCGVAARPEYVEEGVPFLSSKNVKEDRFILNHYNFVSREDYQRLTKYSKPEKGDILYTRVGSFGEAAVINFDMDFAIFVSLTLIKPKRDVVHERYLMHYLNSPRIRNLANNSTSGIGVQNLNVKAVRNFPISLPPLPVQERIAAILDAADALRQKDQALLKKYDDLTQSLFLDMFGDPVSNKRNFESSIIENECVVKGGKRVPKGETLVSIKSPYPYIKAGNIKNGKVTLKNLEYLTPAIREKLKRYIVNSGDVVITVVGANIGDIGVVPKELDNANLTENANKLLIKDKNRLTNTYLSYSLRSDFIQRQITQKTMAVGVPKLALFRINQLELLIPPISVQREFALQIELIEKQKEQIQANIKKSEDLFQSLLQKAFKGELVSEENLIPN